ncbi:transposase [Streptomyces griseoluteus]|uniref:transposase n=1 Tax=Streptomyces griseoluteus TaxID=29306 RepID=UPI0037FFFCAD
MRADLIPDDLWERVARCCRTPPNGAIATRSGCVLPIEWRFAGVMYVLRTGVAWRNVPAEAVGCSGVTAWRRLRDWTEVGVWPRLHAALLTEVRRASLLDLDDCSVDGSHVRALKGGTTSDPRPLIGPALARSTT